ncbi:MAG: biosynthetic peptidoglycan transglycosylase [Bryobacteraceae bacterium]
MRTVPYEPELITNLFDRTREKRRIVRFSDLPKVLVNAVVSVEDKRFFQHSGFDPLRIIKAAYIDLKAGRHAQGASTLSMQLARGFWLTPEKTVRRKLAETMITLHLEKKLSKEKIFEYYANNVDLGRRGSFAIRGFGEAAQSYFGTDVRDLNLAQAATLAGLIQRPSFTNPVRWPDRARSRRNRVLTLMRENGYIDDREYAVASEQDVVVARSGSESTDAPYFVDLVNESLVEKFQEHDFQPSLIGFTHRWLNLQRDAAEAVN